MSDEKKLEILSKVLPRVTLGDIRRHRNRRALHLIRQAIGLRFWKRFGQLVNRNNQIHPRMPHPETTKALNCHARRSCILRSPYHPITR